MVKPIGAETPQIPPETVVEPTSKEKEGFRIKKLGTAVVIALGSSLAVAALVTASLASFGIIPIVAAIGTASACAAVAGFALWRKITPNLPEPLKRISQMIQAVADEALSILALAFLFPINLEKSDPKKKKEDIKNNEVPVLFIHGFLGSSNNWAYHKKRLKEKNHDSLFTINLGDPRDSIETYAEKVRKKLEDIHKITGKKDVIIVAHSMGGLVAREFLYNHNTEGVRVRKIITLATPLEGTKIAKLASWISKSAEEMKPLSAKVKELDEKERKNPQTTYFRIASLGDLIVPWKSAKGQKKVLEDAKLKENFHFEVLEATGHAGQLFSDTVGDIVVREVEAAQKAALEVEA